MEEIEIPIEKIQEQIEEINRENHSRTEGDRWINQAALSSALIAVFASIAAMLSGHHSNEALIEQIQSSDQWTYYQAKGIKGNLLATKMDLMTLSGHLPTEEDTKKVEDYKKDQEKISEIAKEKELDSERHLKIHGAMAKAVTLFQIAIAIAAISILVRRRKFWFGSLFFAILGLGCFIFGFVL